MEDSEFLKLLQACQEISLMFPDGVVYIGGIAVYLHAINHEHSRSLAEFTHDADFYISIAEMSDLSDIEEVQPNRRLKKHQLTKGGFEFDIYTERHSSLIVPYDQVMAYAVKYDDLRVASLAHLTVLKLEAYRDRRASAKGSKDARDLIRIAMVAQSPDGCFDGKLVVGFLGEEHLALLDEVKRGPEFLGLTKGNAKEAKKLRSKFAEFVSEILQANG